MNTKEALKIVSEYPEIQNYINSERMNLLRGSKRNDEYGRSDVTKAKGRIHGALNTLKGLGLLDLFGARVLYLYFTNTDGIEDVSGWNTLTKSSELEEQVKGYIANTVEGYLNGVQWDASLYTPMTMDEWRKYIKTNLEMDIKNGMVVNGIEYKHFRFLGSKRFAELVDIYLDNYDDVQDYIIR